MTGQPEVEVSEPGLHLCLLEDLDRPAPRRLAGIGALSVVVNAFLLIGMAALAAVEGSPPPPPPNALETARSTPLIFPKELTQKEPNRAEVARQLHLDDLVSKPETAPRKPVFAPPPMPKAVASAAVPLPPTVEPPQIRVAEAAPPALGTMPNVAPPPVAPPQTQSAEKPKIAFESPGLQGAPATGRPGGFGKIAPPKATVEDAVRSVVRSGPGGVVIGDSVEEGGIGSTLGQTSSPGRQATQVELLSDPMGVDFKPYLIRVLAAVRRNWFAVIPESARLGRRGRVVIQFSINKAGSVPKLVIAGASGTEALDRAAVAGISASNPFAPLPAEFKGDVIRVQLVFVYNLR